jgi:BCD family chlorophyll transporter-like MFS transporter
MSGRLGEALATPAAGYSFVYHLEIGLLFATLAALGPLVRTRILTRNPAQGSARLGLAEFPT